MQQSITRRDVYEPMLTARIGNREVELASASIERMLPDPVVGGSLTAAHGDLVTVEGDNVVETVATPWDPGTQWPPTPETAASATMDTGSGPVQLLGGGRVVSASGGTGDRPVGVRVSDRYQSLDRSISWDAVAAAMPSIEDRGTSRYVSMLTSSIVDMILRECGWYATPPRLSYAALSVPAMGSMWPERGEVTACGRESDVNYGGYPAWPTTTWGMAVDDCRADYALGGAYSVKSQGYLELTAMQAAPSGASRLEVSSSSGSGLARMQWTASTAYLQVRGPSGVFVNAVSVPRSNGFLYGTIEYISDTLVYCTLRCGGETAGASVAVQAAMTTTAAGQARIIATGPSGGFQVAFPTTAGRLTDWVPNAVQYVRTAQRNNLMVRRSVEGENCANFLQKICEAEAATYWIDEIGVLRWWDLARLEARTTVATLTSDDDITDDGFTWDHSLSSLRSRAAVKWREPLREWSWTTTVDLYQGTGQTVQAGDEQESWINVPDDEVWIMTDTRIQRAPGSGSLTNFNYGWGSWYGGRVDRGDGVDTWVQRAGAGSFVMSMARVTDRAFKLTTRWTGNEPVFQKSIGFDSGSSLWSARRDMDLPIIRGKGKYMFTDQLTYSTQTGPSSAPEHMVDAGWLIQFAEQAAYTADYYGQRVTVPQPTLSSIGIVPLPGLQLGDMVEVRDEHVTRLTVRGLVVEDSRSINAGMDMQHAVAIRPLYVTRNGVTWQEWATAARPKTHAQWASNQNSTWAAWGANPLLKEDVI